MRVIKQFGVDLAENIFQKHGITGGDAVAFTPNGS